MIADVDTTGWVRFDAGGPAAEQDVVDLWPLLMPRRLRDAGCKFTYVWVGVGPGQSEIEFIDGEPLTVIAWPEGGGVRGRYSAMLGILAERETAMEP